MVDTEDIKVWRTSEGKFEKWYYLSNGCIKKHKIALEEFERLKYVYGGSLW